MEDGRGGKSVIRIYKKYDGKRDDEPDEMTRLHKSWARARDGFQKTRKRYFWLAHGWGRHSSWPVQCNTTHLPLPAVVRRCCCNLARRRTCRLNRFVLRLLDQRRKPRLAHLDGRTGMADPVLIFPGRNQNIHFKSPVMWMIQNMLCLIVMRTPRRRDRDGGQCANCDGRAVMCY